MNKPQTIDNLQTDVDYKLKLTMLIGAINVVRLATEDNELRLLLTSVLKAGGCYEDAFIQGLTEWTANDK